MLRYIDDPAREWEGERLDDVLWPLSIQWTMSDAELAELGLEQAPPEPVSTAPTDHTLTRRQFHVVVRLLGIEDRIVAAINAIQDPLGRAVTSAQYAEASAFARNDPLIFSPEMLQAIWPDLTDAQRDAEIDAAWMQASELRL